MPLVTTIVCDECSAKIELPEGGSKESASILQVTNAYGKKFFFCGIDCLIKWAAKTKKALAEIVEDARTMLPEIQ